MREVLHRGSGDSRVLPWRNGRGRTEELAIWPTGADVGRGDFDGRISASRVEEPGPFSSFVGFERVIVVTSGQGLVLTHGADAARVRLRPLEPYRFDGGLATRAELVAGPVDDFNVFARRGRARADVEVLRIGRRRARESVGPGHAFAHALRGCAIVRVPREEDPVEIAARESVWGRELPHEEEWELAGTSDDAVLVLVRWEPIHPA
jgi:environmental stress-induced protein Ves